MEHDSSASRRLISALVQESEQLAATHEGTTFGTNVMRSGSFRLWCEELEGGAQERLSSWDDDAHSPKIEPLQGAAVDFLCDQHPVGRRK